MNGTAWRFPPHGARCPHPRGPDTPRVDPTFQAGCRSRAGVLRLRRTAPAARTSPSECLTQRRPAGLPSPPGRPRDRRVIRGTPAEGSAGKIKNLKVFWAPIDEVRVPLPDYAEKAAFYAFLRSVRRLSGGGRAVSPCITQAAENLSQMPQTALGHLVFPIFPGQLARQLGRLRMVRLDAGCCGLK